MPKNYNAQSSNKSIYKQKMTSNPLVGIYLGIIVDVRDLSRTGMMTVEIATLGKANDKTAGTYDCFWSSPFAGSTDPSRIGKDTEKYNDTQKSYGMWMVPPDVGNTVLVAFADNNPKYPYVISCTYDNKFNHMVPGIPAGKNFSDPDLLMPVAEKNKRSAFTENDGKITHNDAVRPAHKDIAENIVKQGLINDFLRGAGTSGARRESPSEVFGILTPGPKDYENPGSRLGGHQFVMDDNYDSRLIRLRTAGGQQLLMDDTSGVIYVINKKGTAWVELGTNGEINVYSEASINMRAKGSINMRADKDINIEAGRNMNLRATGDRIGTEYKGVPGVTDFSGPLGAGGFVNVEAGADIRALGKQNIKLTAGGGNIETNSAGATKMVSGEDAEGPAGFMINTRGTMILNTQKDQYLTSVDSLVAVSSGPTNLAGSTVDLNSGSAPGLGTLGRTLAAASTLLMRLVAPMTPKRKKDNPPSPPEFDKEGG